jgi:hypothetical protein
VQAELVALRVAHDIRKRTAIAVRVGQLRAKADEAIDLGRLAVFIDMDVQMHPVLRRLAFGHALEEEPGLDARRVLTRCHVAERGPSVHHDPVLRGHAPVGDQLIDQPRVVFDDRAENFGPERSLGVRISTVERHLSSHRQQSCPTESLPEARRLWTRCRQVNQSTRPPACRSLALAYKAELPHLPLLEATATLKSAATKGPLFFVLLCSSYFSVLRTSLFFVLLCSSYFSVLRTSLFFVLLCSSYFSGASTCGRR